MTRADLTRWTRLVALLTLPVLAQAQGDDLPARWAASPHADATAEAFTHWNAEGEIPTDCAACHSRPGYLDLLGADGSAAGSVEQAADVGTVVDCDTCHDAAAMALESVTFPSGDRVSVGRSAQCLVCHQGRESSVSVQDALGALPLDEVAADLGFINVHYAIAGATLYGGEVRGGYQYADRDYAGRFAHVEGANHCSDCHDPHALTIDTTTCQGCHQTEWPRQIRAREDDLDGDGDTAEGIASEILALRGALQSALVDYATRQSLPPLVYAEQRYPYFFVDTNGNGTTDADEAAFPNRYDRWTPRLLRAAYNFHYANKDSGAYVHNADYVAQLLVDSINDLANAPGGSGATSPFLRPGVRQ